MAYRKTGAVRKGERVRKNLQSRGRRQSLWSLLLLLAGLLHAFPVYGSSFGDEEGALVLQKYLQEARRLESGITGEDPEQIPISRFLVSNREENDQRVRSIASRAGTRGSLSFYVIGKEFEPNGCALAEWYGGEAVYGNLPEEQILLEGVTYHIARMALEGQASEGGCRHEWSPSREREPGCLTRGSREYVCRYCGAEQRVYRPPTGHRDGDGDSLCDRCRAGISPGDPEELPRIHWQEGDLLELELSEGSWRFRCIDENYGDEKQNHRKGALFLCDSIIPSDLGARWELFKTETGAHEARYVPGPLAVFGETEEYRYSGLRNWLLEQEAPFFYMEPIQIGTAYAYRGSRPQGSYGGSYGDTLEALHIGDQKLLGKLFLFSVDEALRYREALWRFEGSDRDNPETQASAFSRGYWLRSPLWAPDGDSSGCAYVVELSGGIRPASVKPLGGTGDALSDQTVPYGIRPAFVMPQD